MRKILVTIIAIAIAGLVSPNVSAAEQATNSYTGAAGFFVTGVGGVAVMCPQACYSGTTGMEVLPDNFGGAHLVAASGTLYTNVVIGIDDQGFWGSSGATSTCFWNPEGDNICDGDDFGSDWLCGGVGLLGSPFASDFVTVWVQAFTVEDDLDVCGGTFGTLSGDFF